MKDTEKSILLQRITNHLLLNVSLLDNLGLCFGKVGVAIFLYHYARFSDNPLFHEFADEIVSELVNEVHDELSVDLGNGYCGIGWSIEYLMHCGFVDGDSTEILEDIEKRILERDVCRINDTTLLTGLEGIFHYVLIRLFRCTNSKAPFDKEYLNSLDIAANNIVKKKNHPDIVYLASQFLQWKKNRVIIYDPNTLIKKIISDNTIEELEIKTSNLGLKEGCSGLGLNLILHEKELVHSQ